MLTVIEVMKTCCYLQWWSEVTWHRSFQILTQIFIQLTTQQIQLKI